MNGHDPRPEAFDDAFAPAPLEAVDQRLYREAMSRYGAAVHVITTDGSSGKAGFTATAVCSVTDDPPTLLVCLHRKGQVVPILAANCVFCVNTLAYTDEGVSNVFAGRTGAKLAERFETGLWESLKTGAPRSCHQPSLPVTVASPRSRWSVRTTSSSALCRPWRSKRRSPPSSIKDGATSPYDLGGSPRRSAGAEVGPVASAIQHLVPFVADPTGGVRRHRGRCRKLVLP
jgi:hypothetical protein